MSKPTVVPLRAAPPLHDLAGQLRQLADRIERGDPDLGTPLAIHVVMETDERFQPFFFAWGRVGERHHLAGLFTHCAQLALTDRED